MSNYQIFNVDDCMYVAALSDADAREYVKKECGDDCGWSVEARSSDRMVETADVDEGETPTATSKKTMRELVPGA